MSDAERGDGLFRISAVARPFEYLVALQARWVGNRLGRRFPLNLLLEVEEHRLAIRIKSGLLQRIGQSLHRQSDAAEPVLQLRIRLRHCYVRYRSAEIDIVSESKYQSVISDGKFEIRTSEKAHAQAKSQHGLGLDMKAVRSPHMLRDHLVRTPALRYRVRQLVTIRYDDNCEAGHLRSAGCT